MAAELILVMGKSGTGKSSMLRNLSPKETFIFKPNLKSFPFPGGDDNYKVGVNLVINSELDAIASTIQAISDKGKHIKYVVLDDFTHFFSSRIFSPSFLARNSGGEAFQRWNDFGASVFQALFANTTLRDDLFIIIIHHTEVKEDGTIGFKSAGKLLDNTIDFPSYFTYIFHTVIKVKEESVEYLVQTNLDGIRHAKTPYGVFPDLYVKSDIKSILDRITAYKKGEVKVEWK